MGVVASDTLTRSRSLSRQVIDLLFPQIAHSSSSSSSAGAAVTAENARSCTGRYYARSSTYTSSFVSSVALVTNLHSARKLHEISYHLKRDTSYTRAERHDDGCSVGCLVAGRVEVMLACGGWGCVVKVLLCARANETGAKALRQQAGSIAQPSNEPANRAELAETRREKTEADEGGASTTGWRQTRMAFVLKFMSRRLRIKYIYITQYINIIFNQANSREAVLLSDIYSFHFYVYCVRVYNRIATAATHLSPNPPHKSPFCGWPLSQSGGPLINWSTILCP